MIRHRALIASCLPASLLVLLDEGPPPLPPEVFRLESAAEFLTDAKIDLDPLRKPKNPVLSQPPPARHGKVQRVHTKFRPINRKTRP